MWRIGEEDGDRQIGNVENRGGGIYVILSLYIILGYDLRAPPPPLLVMLWRLRTKQGGRVCA